MESRWMLPQQGTHTGACNPAMPWLVCAPRMNVHSSILDNCPRWKQPQDTCIDRSRDHQSAVRPHDTTLHGLETREAPRPQLPHPPLRGWASETCRGKESSHKRPHVIGFLLYNMFRIDKSSEAESSGRLAAGLGEGGWGGQRPPRECRLPCGETKMSRNERVVTLVQHPECAKCYWITCLRELKW